MTLAVQYVVPHASMVSGYKPSERKHLPLESRSTSISAAAVAHTVDDSTTSNVRSTRRTYRIVYYHPALITCKSLREGERNAFSKWGLRLYCLWVAINLYFPL